jgi:hypothetical protein
MSMQRGDLSTNMSDEQIKKRMGSKIAGETKIPRLLNGTLNDTSQQSQ